MMRVVSVLPGDSLWSTYLNVYVHYLLENFSTDFKEITAQSLAENIKVTLSERYKEGGRGFFLLYMSQQIVGMSNVWLSYKNITVLNIAEFYIYPNYQRRGLGRFLYQQMLHWGRQYGVQKAALEADISNTEAHCFWRGMGLHAVSNDDNRMSYEAAL